MTTQLEMPVRKAPKVDQRRITNLKLALKEHQGWVKASELCWLFDLNAHETGRRMVRQAADLSAPEIISGQEGYKHISHATPEEIQHAANWLISQGRKMINRGLAILRRGHEIGKL